MTIYILENHPLMSHAISQMLRKIDPTKILVEIHSYSKLQEAMVINGQPEAFIVDPLLNGLKGTTGIKQLKTNYPATQLILLSSIPRDEGESSCIASGADLYIEKTEIPKFIADLIIKQLGWTANSKIGKPLGFPNHHPMKLSKRHLQILILVDAGLSNEDIGNKLNISAHTVKVHLWRLFKKIGINSRTQLSKFARDNGYL